VTETGAAVLLVYTGGAGIQEDVSLIAQVAGIVLGLFISKLS
jgi:hypothetical protein